MEAILDHHLDLDETQLISDLVQRRPEALSALVARYQGVLTGVIMKVLHNRAETEDVMQEVFLQVWDRAATYAPEKGKLLSWLSTVARRRAIDRVRQSCAYHRATDRFETTVQHESQETEHHFGHDAADRDVRELIDRQLDLLPDLQKQAVSLAFLDGRSQREIAEITHTPLGTVKTRIELGLKKLTQSIGSARHKIL